VSEIARPWEIHEPPLVGCTDAELLAWYAREVSALIKAGGGREYSREHQIGYVAGLQKALALLTPNAASAWGAHVGPFVNEP
jgi:hypothetical protein